MVLRLDLHNPSRERDADETDDGCEADEAQPDTPRESRLLALPERFAMLDVFFGGAMGAVWREVKGFLRNMNEQV